MTVVFAAEAVGPSLAGDPGPATLERSSGNDQLTARRRSRKGGDSARQGTARAVAAGQGQAERRDDISRTMVALVSPRRLRAQAA